MQHTHRTSIRNAGVGFGLAALFVPVVLNLAGLGLMVTASGMGVVAGVALWLLFGVAFTAIQIGFKSIGLAADEGPRGGTLIPIKVVAMQRKRR